MPISFHRSLRAFASAVPNTTGESLNHPYMARVELTHRTALPVREGWTEVVQEPAAVGNIPLGPEHEEANDPLSPATRFLRHLEEDLVPWHFDYMVDSDRDYLHPHSPLQSIAHTLRLGNLQPSFMPITQVSALPKERDPNDDTPAPDPPLPALLPGQRLLCGPSLDRWLEQDLHPEPVVLRLFDGMQCILGRFKREREELEQEEAPWKKRTCKQYKCKIRRQEDNSPTPIISKRRLRPRASLQKPCRYL